MISYASITGVIAFEFFKRQLVFHKSCVNQFAEREDRRRRWNNKAT